MSIADDVEGWSELYSAYENAVAAFEKKHSLNFEHNFDEFLNAATDTKETVHVVSQRLRELIKTHELSKESKERFRAEVQALLSEGIFDVEIFLHNRLLPFEPDSDWFGTREFSESGIIEAKHMVMVYHPSLLSVAEEEWGTNQRVSIHELKPANDAFKSVVGAGEAPKWYGLPNVGKDIQWDWIGDPENTITKIFKLLNLDFSLNDYVIWECDGAVEELRSDASIGTPKLFEKDVPFGHIPESCSQFSRSGLTHNWRTDSGQYVSPIWEYLGWSCDNFGERKALATAAASIGRGMQAICFLSDGKFSHSERKLGRHLEDVFAAGKAVVTARVELELRDDIVKGRRGKKGAERRVMAANQSATERKRIRLKAFMEAIEEFREYYPKFSEVTILEEAFKLASSRTKGFWKAKAGQAEKYASDLSSHPDFQRRYYSVFWVEHLSNFGKFQIT